MTLAHLTPIQESFDDLGVPPVAGFNWRYDWSETQGSYITGCCGLAARICRLTGFRPAVDPSYARPDVLLEAYALGLTADEISSYMLGWDYTIARLTEEPIPDQAAYDRGMADAKEMGL